MKRLSPLLLAALCAAPIALPHRASEACIIEGEIVSESIIVAHESRSKSARTEKDASVLERSTDALNAGRNTEVLTTLYGHYGLQINQWALNPDAFGERERMVVLMVSLAVLRTEGAYERYHEVVVAEGRRRVDNVRWAIRAVEGLAFVGFAADRHVAEAWARDPALRRAALEKLELLDQHGRLSSKFQKELLTRLRADLGPSLALAGR